MMVLHTCDTPRCWNPDHLYEGTGADNNRDCRERGRMAMGLNHPHGILTDEEVVAIFRDPRVSREVADDYGVSSAMVRMIRLGKRKSWITGVVLAG
jgi:hypothetical protein